MADFTALKTAITNAIKQNGNQAITGNLLQEILIAMVESMGDTALNGLATSIQISLNSLSAEDGNLANAISSEASTRQFADNSLSSAINSEASARSNADSALQQNINTESNQRQSTDTSLQNQITTEKNARIDAVNRLQGLINAINDVIGNGYTYGGIATPNGAPQQGKMFYIALKAGNYVNYGNVPVNEGINILKKVGNQWVIDRLFDVNELLVEVNSIVANYKPIIINGNVTNAPDEVDITSNNLGLLQFKDKAYSQAMFSGLGRKYLRKNIRPLTPSVSFDGFVENVEVEESPISGDPDVIFFDRLREAFVAKKDDKYYLTWDNDDAYVPLSNEIVYMNEGTPYRWDGTDLVVDDSVYPDLKNILTQDMMSAANTIYVIQYDFTLGEDITVPANCVLEFDGGSISGEGIVTGQNTIIKADDTVIFNNITISGSWICSNIYSSWFSDISQENKLKELFKLCNDTIYNKVIIKHGTYNVSGNENEAKILEIVSNTDVELLGVIQLINTNYAVYSVLYINEANNVSLYGEGKIIGNRDTWTASGEWGMGIDIQDSENINVIGIEVSKCTGDAIYIGGDNYANTNININIRNCKLHDCRRQGVSIITGNKINITDNYIYDIDGTSPKAAIDIEPNNAEQIISNVCISNNIMNNCSYGILLAFHHADFSNIVIDNNNCKNCHYGLRALNTSGQSRVCLNIQANNNIFDNVDIGFEIFGTENFILENNKFICITNDFSRAEGNINLRFLHNSYIGVRGIQEQYNNKAIFDGNILDINSTGSTAPYHRIYTAMFFKNVVNCICSFKDNDMVVSNIFNCKSESQIQTEGTVRNFANNTFVIDENYANYALRVNGNGSIIKDNTFVFKTDPGNRNYHYSLIRGNNNILLNNALEYLFVTNIIDQGTGNVVIYADTAKNVGIFADRPTSNIYIGFRYFCISGASIDGGTTEKTNLSIFYTGSGWVDGSGNAVVAKS